MKKIILLFALTSTVLLSCSDSNETEDSPVVPAKIVNLRNTNSLHIDTKSADFLAISKFSEFVDFKEKKDLNLSAMTLIKFDEANSSRAILIPINSDSESTIKRNLLISFNIDYTRHRLMVVEREGEYSSKGVFSGVNKIKTLEEQVLIEEYIKDNKIDKIVANDQRNLRQPAGPISSCSYAEFNYYYQILMNNCSNDAACDIACSAAGPLCSGGIALQSLDMCFAYDYNP